MATESLINVGIREECGTLGMRNFEDSGTVAYVCNYANGRIGMTFVDNTVYHVGDTLPFDVANTSYSTAAVALLRSWWEQGWILPLI